MVLISDIVAVAQQSFTNGPLWFIFTLSTTFWSLISLVYIVYCAYNLSSLNPLSSYPGPKLWAVSRLPLIRCNIAGRLPQKMAELHEKYGDVVRIAPNELSYVKAQAWQDIYGHKSVGEWPKALNGQGHWPPPNGVHAIVTTPSKEDHARMRKAMAPAFADRALRDQEPVLTRYIDKFITKLDQASLVGAVNMVEWLNYLTFDTIGDLSYSDSFGCLEAGSYHPWISFIFNLADAMPWIQAFHYYGVYDLLQFITPKSLVGASQRHVDMSYVQVSKRLDKGVDKSSKDFMSHVMKAETVTVSEMHSLSQTIIMAGSETAASCTCAVFWFMLANATVYDTLVKEIRTRFLTEKEITIATAAELNYLLAVVDESLRVFPPAPSSLPRVVGPVGGIIEGQYVPPGAKVGISIYAANHYSKNFARADEFLPERYLVETRGTGEFANDDLAASQPFAYGPRNCIGKSLAYAEMRLIICRFLWNFDIELAPGSEGWHSPCAQKAFLIWDKKPLMLSLTNIRKK